MSAKHLRKDHKQSKVRVKSPASKRSLSFTNVDSHLNIDEFEQTEELQLKVDYVIITKSGNILTRVPQERETQQLFRDICDKKWHPQPTPF